MPALNGQTDELRKTNKMEKGQYIKVFTGSEQTAILLKGRLQEIGIESIIKDDSTDAFLGHAPRVVDLYISSKNIEKANPVLLEIRAINS